MTNKNQRSLLSSEQQKEVLIRMAEFDAGKTKTYTVEEAEQELAKWKNERPQSHKDTKS